MDAFPAFVPLAGATVVVVGEGEAADAKARLFDGAPCRLVRYPEAAAAEFGGARLAFIAIEDEAAAAGLAARARADGALVNVVDRPALGDFATPSIVDRGRVVGAVGTGGSAPVLAVRLRQEIETRWPERLGALAQLFDAMRAPARAVLPTMDLRRRFFRTLAGGEAARLALAGEATSALARARAELDSFVATPARCGRLALLIAPAELERLTIGAARRLGDADRLVVLGAPPADLLGFARRDAPRATRIDAAALREQLAGGDDVVVVAAVEVDPIELGALGPFAPAPLT